MMNIFKALASTILLMEIIGVAALVLVWAVLMGLHASGAFIIGAEVVTVCFLAALAVILFRVALRAEKEMAQAGQTGGETLEE